MLRQSQRFSMASRYMSVFIETLTGVAFELTCSPLDTVFIIKRKIYILEDIPVQQQHLIFRGQELCDPLTLIYYGICSGTTIRLVTGMQVGPANSKKAEHEMLIDLAHFVHHFREQPGYDGVDPIVIASEDSMQFFFPDIEVENTFDDLPDLNEISSESVGAVCMSEEEDEARREENDKLKEKMKFILTQLKLSRAEKENRNALMHPDKDASKGYPVAISIEENLANKFSHLTVSKNNEENTFPTIPLKNEEKGSCSKSLKYSNGSNSSIEANACCEDNFVQSDISKGGSGITNTSHCPCTDNISLSLGSINPAISNNGYPVADGSLADKQILPYLYAPANTKCSMTNESLLSFPNASINSLKSGEPPYPISTLKSQNLEPLTNSPDFPPGRFSNLDEWLDNRPKTMPQEDLCCELDDIVQKQVCRFSLSGIQLNRNFSNDNEKPMTKQSLCITVPSSFKSNCIAQSLLKEQDSTWQLNSSVPSKETSENISFLPKLAVGSLVATGSKVKECPGSCSEASSASSQDLIPEMCSEKHGTIAKLPSIEAKRKKRCSWCKKKIGLTTTYTCRCGKDFCGPHRYAETHECTYDYRAEGQQTVLKNSAIRAPKLPKI